MNLIKIENNQIILNEETNKQLASLYEFKAKFDVLMDAVKTEMLEKMEQSGITSFENEVIKVIYKKATTRKSVDTKALKEQGLYENFLVESPVKSSVSVSYK